MTTVNVLDLRDTYEVGGPGKTILETYRAIDATRFRLHLGVFLVKGEADDTPFLREARSYGMPVHLISGHNQYDPRLISRTAELVRSLGIDIVHAHEVKSDVIAYMAAKLHRVPIVTTMHGWIGNTSKQRALIALDKKVARGFDRVLAVSGKIRDQLLSAGVPESRVRLVHNAIVLDRYQRTGSHGFLASLVGQPVPAPVLVCVGRLSSEKGQADLVEALGMVAAGGHRVSAVLAGDGPDKSRLEQQIQALGLGDRIFLPGYIDRPQRILEEADLSVLPSHTEGLPNAALEALAMGVPVLATRVGGTPEVIEDGVTGRLVPASSPQALAKAIEDFLANRSRWTEMAERGRVRVTEQFDFGARTRKVEDIYDELLREPTP